MRTVSWDAEGPSVQLIDQQLLPGEVRILRLHEPAEVAAAIRDMRVRGAPAIGAAAAYGLALAGMISRATETGTLWDEVETAAAALRESRPTAVNLSWAIERVLRAGRVGLAEGAQSVRDRLLTEAQRIADEDVETNRRMGEYGAALIQDGAAVIHHCNTGALATVDYGTALGVIRTAHEQGKRVHVLVDETRPQLQGGRLTAWELRQLGIPFEIIADGAAGHMLRRGEATSVFVGADRIAANGDVANKIGTYMLALAAFDNRVPFYVVAPLSTVDTALPDGETIPIEERPEDEVLDLSRSGRPVFPEGSRARNPAFDITPARLVTAIVTEAGILRPPFAESLARALQESDIA
jgi:methylthioribose-1-phosphate isomerase